MGVWGWSSGGHRGGRWVGVELPQDLHRVLKKPPPPCRSSFRKILAPIKIKSALPPPAPKPNFQNTLPPPNEEFYGHSRGFPAERRHFFQVSIKLAQPFPAPELRTKIFTDTRIFLKFLRSHSEGRGRLEGGCLGLPGLHQRTLPYCF